MLRPPMLHGECRQRHNTVANSWGRSACFSANRYRRGSLSLQVSDFVLENRKPADAVSEMVDSFR